MPPDSRILAIDWSGAVHGSRRKIWLAEATEAGVVRLESGRTREELANHLIDLASRAPQIVVGLDFAFSFPAWFLQERRLPSAHDLWAECSAHGEDWLRSVTPPFWGRPRCRRPTDVPVFRRTEEALPTVGGTRPKSPFQVGGAGAVGTGSIRGMPVLHRLVQAGFAVWPFDPPRQPLLIEIYPRLLTGAVRKSRREERHAYLDRRTLQFPETLRTAAEESEDAFDAAISALVMAESRASFAMLPAADDEVEKLEGRIWCPSQWRSAPGA